MWGIYTALHRPFKSHKKEKYILIANGQSSAEIAQDLKRNDVVSSAVLLHWYLRWRGPTFSLKAGEYRFKQPLSLIEVAKKIHRGDIHQYRATLPEGLTFRQVTTRLESEGFGQATAFNEICLTPDLIIDLDHEAPNLEGYLFPETYYFARNTNANLIISRFVEEFRRIWTKSRQQQADNLGMTIREIVTLASLIEKETSMPSERPLVSAVLHNRLKRNMKLECDPTVIVAISKSMRPTTRTNIPAFLLAPSPAQAWDLSMPPYIQLKSTISILYLGTMAVISFRIIIETITKLY